MKDHSSHRGAWAGRPGRHALLIGVAGWLLVAGIGSADASTVSVAAVNFEFRPETRSVSVGDVVRWTFAGDPHTVTSGTPGSPDGRFDSGIKDPGAGYQVTFDTAGTFPYFCQIHPEQMTGTIVVSAGPVPTPKPTARPTARPTVSPSVRPTVRPTATATARPTSTAVATASPTTAATAVPSATASATATASASLEPTGSPTPSARGDGTPSPTSEPGAGPSAAGVDPLPIVLGLAVLAVLAAGGLALARRRGAAQA